MFKNNFALKTISLAILLAGFDIGILTLVFKFVNNPNFLLLASFVCATFVLAAIFLSAKVRKTLLWFVKLINNLPQTNLEEELIPQSSDEFGKVVTTLENFRQNLKAKILNLEEERDRAQALLTNIAEGVFTVNLRGEIIVFNQVAERLFEYSHVKIVGKNYNQTLRFLNSKTKEYYNSFIDKVLLDGKTINLPSETVLVSATNIQIPVAVSASTVKNHKGVIIGAIVIFRDVTREMELEEMRSDLLSIASHQLRTPISEIKGLTELLVDNVAGPLNDKQKEYLNLLQFANERMISLINDLLNVSRLEQGRLQFQFNVFDLGKITNEVFNLLKIRAGQKSQNFFLQVDESSHLVWVDENKTKEIVSNLLENALKYTFPGGTIQARVTTDENGVWFLVKDTGVGIPIEKQQELFKKFSRVENPLSKTTTGTGLGLYTVKQMVERQNGKVWLKSEEGKGSTFAIVFPLAKTL